MFAFISRYTLALYDALCLRRNLARSVEEFSVADFRAMLGVESYYYRFTDLRRHVLEPVTTEINALSDFNVSIKQVREGGKYRGTLQAFRVTWEAKGPSAWMAALNELARPKVGLRARLLGKAETATDFPGQ